MMKSPSLIFLCTLLMFTNSGKVTIACIQNSQCNSGYGLFYSNSTRSYFQCVKKACHSAIKYNYRIDNCSNDMYKMKCQTGLCLFEETMHMCFYQKDFCPKEMSVAQTCGKCKQIYCVNDLCATVRGLQMCFESQDMCYYESARVMTGACENNLDFFKNQCGCCLDTLYKGLNAGICSDNQNFNLNSTKIQIFANSQDYAKSFDPERAFINYQWNESNESNETNFEFLSVRSQLYIVLSLAMWSL